MPLIDLNGLGHFKDKENAMIAEKFSASKAYAAGDYCYYNGTLYKFKTAHAAGAWTTSDVETVKLAHDVTDLKESLPQQAIILAAYDSSDVAKRRSDLSSNSENGGIDLINTAISLLPNGGRIYLRRGTYKGAVGVNINVNNITIEGECDGVTIQRASGNDIFANGTTGIVLKNITANAINLYNGAEYRLENCNIATTHVDVDTDSIKGIFVPPYRGIDEINKEIYNMGDNGGTILLGEGEYTGDKSLNFYRSVSPAGYKKNVRIVGCGYKTVISRNTGVNDVVANSDSIENCILENVRIAHNVQRIVANPTKMLRLVSCWLGTKYVDESEEQAVNIVNVGKGRFFETYSAAYGMFYVNSYPIGKTARWEIHIWGHIVETAPVILDKGYIDLIGHNAIVELRGGKSVRFTFGDPSTSYYGDRLGVVKDIHFVKTGCYNYYQDYCVYVRSDTVKFYNCIFENASSSPTPFDQRDYVESQEATAGARRHGIGIECTKWGYQCETEFHDCIGIGSPYGFMNTRGWYIVFGSPKLYNCVGYGGGIGEFCHGIINHRSSQAELFNCIGYASKTAFRKSAGIRFQAAGSSHLTGCVGYGSGGTQYISEGVSAERITAICTELGIDPSTYVVGGVVQYSALTDEICAKIENSDITLTPLNTNTEEGYGISFCANSGSAKLVNCEGFCGSGNNSHGLHCVGSATPTINGGYFGIKDMLQDISLDSGSAAYMLADLGAELNPYSKFEIKQITLSILGSPTTENDVFYAVTTETTPQTICGGTSIKDVSSIAFLECTPRVIAAGAGLKFFIKRDGVNIQIPANKYIAHIQYNYAADNSSAVYIGGTANPLITNAIARAAEGCDAVEVENTVNTVRMFDCALHGDVDSGVTFATKTAMNSSSNYAI